MQNAMSEGPGLDQIEQAVQPLFAQVSEALTILADAVQELKCRVDNIDGQFGGFTTGLSGVIDKRRRGEFVGSLREKYPDFGKFEEIIKQLADVDVYDEIGNDLYEYKSAPDYSDDGLEAKVKEMLEQISGKFGPIIEALEKSKAPKEEDKPAGEKPVTAVEVEIEKSGVDPKLRKYLKTAS
jgi:hypothetical protein